MPAKRDYTVFAIVPAQLRTIEPELQRNTVDIFLATKDLKFYTTEAKAMEAIVTEQNKAWKDAANLGVRAIRCEDDKLGACKTYPAPVYFMQQMELSPEDWRAGIKGNLGRQDGFMGQYPATHGLPIGLPTVFIGKDDVSDIRILVPDTRSARKFTATIVEAAHERMEQLQNMVNDKYHALVAEHQARIQPYEEYRKQEQSDTPRAKEDHGKVVIAHWMNELNHISGYENFAPQLASEYRSLSVKTVGNAPDTSYAAYTALERVFREVQMTASRKKDYQTATAAQGIVRMAASALDEMKETSSEEKSQQNNGRISREEAAAFGLDLSDIYEDHAYV